MVKTGRGKIAVVFYRIFFGVEQIFDVVKSDAVAGSFGLGRKGEGRKGEGRKGEGRKEKGEKEKGEGWFHLK